ncbi:MAG: RAD55 family ATPase [Candidatus Nanohaloarchaea archaeon]
MKRINTGIKNFDRLLGGGMPERELVLIEGPPGSGKSNLGLEFLYRGAQKGEKGLYVTFQDKENEVLRTTTFDWDFEEAVESGKINIVSFDPYRYEQIGNMLRSTVKEKNATRVVLDPITDLDVYIDSRKDRRKNLLEIKNGLRELGATGMLIAEESEATDLEEEVADIILKMDVIRNKGELERQIYVKKLKGSEYDERIHNYVFQSDGLKIQ